MFQRITLLFCVYVFCTYSSLAQSKIQASSKKFEPILNSKQEALPIKPSRAIAFTTKEASWIDVDVSPDGKTLLCSFLGNLYSLPSTGGTATQITRGLGINRYPVWSPDGKYFAYLSDASGFMQVHVSDSAGIFHKVLGETKNQLIPWNLRLLWLPDSKHVVAGNNVYDLSGGTFSLQEEIACLLGSPPNSRFMYWLEVLGNDSSTLISFNRLTAEKQSLFVYEKPWYRTNLERAKMSSDGNWLTYIKYDQDKNGNPSPADSLVIVDLKTGKEKLLAHLGIKFTGFLNNQHYSFSTDSKYLFVGYGGKIHRIEISTGKNELIPFTAKVNVDMGDLDYHTFPVSVDSFEAKYIRSAQKSPDGKQIVFSGLNRIYIQGLPNGKPRMLVYQPFGQFQPAFSPDGKWIAYVTWSDTIGGHLWRVSADGKDLKQLSTTPAQYQHPSWSPDGKMIVVVKGDNKLDGRFTAGEGRMDIITIADKSVRQIDETIPLFNRPVFSNYGKQILYTPNQMGAKHKFWPQLVSFDLLTSVERELFTARIDNEATQPIRQILLSPNNRYIVFMVKEDLYLASVINMGNQQLILDEKEPITVIRFGRGCIDPVWEDGGKTLSWLNTNQYCSINPDKIVEAAMHLQPTEALEGLPKTKIIDVSIPADKTVAIHLKVSRQYGYGMVALKNARIVAMGGNDVIEHGTVIIKNGRFFSLGEADKMNIPKGATVIDVTGKTIIPGLIDVHSHMNGGFPPDVFYQQTWERLMNLCYGVTTRRNPSATVDEFGYNELTETGQMLGPRAFTVGRTVFEQENLNNLKEAKIIVNNRAIYGATYIKQYLHPTRLQRQLLLQACKEAGVNMTNEKEEEPLDCLGMFKDGSTGVEHNPTWGEVYDDVIKAVSRSGTYLCPTLQVCRGFEKGKHYFHKLYGRDFINKSSRFMSEDYRKQLENEIKEDVLDTGFIQQARIDARIKHAGGKIVMGSHGEDQGIGAHWEMWALQMGGLTNHEALETATITAAEALGMQKDLGSIEVGKIADLIILDKNPLEDIHNTNTIKYVMKAGVLYESETLDQVWPNKVKCPEWRMKAENK